MKKSIVLIACFVTICISASVMGQNAKSSQEKKEVAVGIDTAASLSVAGDGKYVPVEKYDPQRDADKDINDALVEAKMSNRRVLLEVGGLWCIWCRHMDEFFEKQPAVLAIREKYYVTVKINYSEENKNEAVISRYGKVAGYPHIFVLDMDGSLLHSQDTAELEEGKGYNTAKFSGFLKKWSAESSGALEIGTQAKP